MKIKTKEMSYEEVLKLPRLQHKKPLKPQMWLATVVRLICIPRADVGKIIKKVIEIKR